jgi:hypothetical protein
MGSQLVSSTQQGNRATPRVDGEIWLDMNDGMTNTFNF